MTKYISSLEKQLEDINLQVNDLCEKRPNNWLNYTKEWDISQNTINNQNLSREILEFLEITTQFTILSYDNILQFNYSKLNKTKLLKDVNISTGKQNNKANTYYSCPEYTQNILSTDNDYKLFIKSLLDGLSKLAMDGVLVCKLPPTKHPRLMFSAVSVCSKMFSEGTIVYRPVMSSPHNNTAYVLFFGFNKLTKENEKWLNEQIKLPAELNIDENIVDYCECYLSTEIRRLNTMVREFNTGAKYPEMNNNLKRGMEVWNNIFKAI